MASEELLAELRRRIAAAGHRRELALDVMYALQRECGWLNDGALAEGAALLGMTPLELEELATFYDFIYREPVGRYVIHVCDGMVCRMRGNLPVMEYLGWKLGLEPGGTTEDRLFTLLPVACIGFCDRAPAMLINGELHGLLTPGRIEAVLDDLRGRKPPPVVCR